MNKKCTIEYQINQSSPDRFAFKRMALLGADKKFVEVFDYTVIEIETDESVSGYGEVYPLGPLICRPMALVEKFTEIYGNTHEVIVLSVDELTHKHGSWAKGPTLDQQMASKKLRDATGWEPVIIDYQSSDVFAQSRAARSQ